MGENESGPIDSRRRAIIRAAAWSVPAVAVAVATPAVTASVPQIATLVFQAGTSGVQESGAFHEFVFRSAQVVALGAPITASTLTLTVTYTPDAGSSLLYVRSNSVGAWARTDSGQSTSTNLLEYTYAVAVAADGVAILPNGAYFENYAAGQHGTFHLIFSAPGFISALADYTF